MKSLLIRLSAVLLMAPASLMSAETSFDCSKADSSAQELVCSDDGLAALDLKMADTWTAALKFWQEEQVYDEIQTQHAIQRGWIKGRDDCWKADDLRQCVEDSYKLRIAELQIISGQLEVPEVQQYQCDNEQIGNLYVVPYPTDPKCLVITRAGQPGPDSQAMAWLAPGDGEKRYQGNRVSFLSQGKEAIISWEDEDGNIEEGKCIIRN